MQPMRLSLLKQLDLLGLSALTVSMTCLVTVLQRGNTENWFDSDLIVRLSLTSVVFLALFAGSN